MYAQTESKPLSALRAHEARLLALMLRTSRLTWLFAADGTDKTTLLASGVMPLLQRRAGERFDRQAPAGPQSRLAAGADRESTKVAGQLRRTEIAIYFDQWGESPLVALKSLIVQSLPSSSKQSIDANVRLSAMLDQIHRDLGLNMVFVLNNFERFFLGESSHLDRSKFADEWIEVVLHPRVTASFLVALDENSRSRIDQFKSRIPGLDHNALRLLPQTLHGPDAPEPPVAQARQPLPRGDAEGLAAAAEPATRRPTLVKYTSKQSVTRAPIKVAEVYAFIESTLAKTGAQHGILAWHGGKTAAPPPVVPTLMLDLEVQRNSISTAHVATFDEPVEPRLYEPVKLEAEAPRPGTIKKIGNRLAVALALLGARHKR